MSSDEKARLYFIQQFRFKQTTRAKLKALRAGCISEVNNTRQIGAT